MDTPIVPPMKRCTKCGVEYPATLEHFHKQKLRKDGSVALTSRCISCLNVINAEQRAKNPNRKKEWYYANLERVQQYSRDYYSKNKTQLISKNSEWVSMDRNRNPQKWRVHDRKAYLRRIENRRSYYVKNRDKLAAYGSNYRKTHSELLRVYGQTRRARKKGAAGHHTVADIKAQYERQCGKCYYCGAKVGSSYHVDHVVPLSRGGSNDISNLVIACPTCNQKKRARLPHEFSEGGRLL